MPIIKKVKDKTPHIANSVWIAENATITGEVSIKENCSIWFNVVVRGDVNSIEIGEKTNIQDGVIIHCTYKGANTIIKNNVTVGHGAILHGCKVEDNALIGMKAVVLDNAEIGEGAIVAAGAVIKENTKVAPYTLWAGVPAKQIKKLDKDKLKPAQIQQAENYIMYSKWYG